MVRQLDRGPARHRLTASTIVRPFKATGRMSMGPGSVLRLGQDSQGREILAAPYDEEIAQKSVGDSLARKTSVSSTGSSGGGETPTPGSDKNTISDSAGPVRRFNDVFTDLGSVQLEAMGLDGYEISNAAATVRDEMYRSEFPVVQPRFVVKCADEDCGAEYDRDVDFCVECAREEMMSDGHEVPPTDPDEIPEDYRDGYPVRQPNPTEKREARRLAESVNKEGQSLRELMKALEDDQGRLGVSVVVVRKEYTVAAGDTRGYDEGDVIWEDVSELVRGDPKRVVPVVDGDARVGGHWWTCPVHREEARVDREDYENGERRCDECNAELREVFFVEQDQSKYSNSSQPEKYFFEDEVITWARYFPRLHGLDGLSPVHHVWLKQAILHWMDIYGAAFFDPDSERYPNKFMVVHTTNPDAWERQFDKAEEDAKENPYSEQIMYNEYSGESNSTPEVQVIDLMSDELLGQDQQIRDQYKQDIRTQFGVTNVFDSELSDAGGLNNEGLQMEVTDRSIATAMNDTVEGPLDELAKTLGIEDHKYEFVPPQDTDIEDLRSQVDVGAKAAKNGLEPRFEDGEVEIPDGEFEAGGEGEGEGGGLADLFAEFEGDGPEGLKADPMANGHDLNPETGRGTCEESGEEIRAKTMQDLTGECPHCGDALSVLEEKQSGGDADDGAGGEPAERHDGTERAPGQSAGEREPERKRQEEPDAPERAGDWHINDVDGVEGGWRAHYVADEGGSQAKVEPRGGEYVVRVDGDVVSELGGVGHQAAVNMGAEYLRENPPEGVNQKSGGRGVPIDALAEKADVSTFTVLATEDDDRFDTGTELGWGAEFPNSGCYVDWNVDAWPDEEQLGGPHVSEYDSVDDAATVAEGDIVFDAEGEEGNERSPDGLTTEEKLEQVRKLDDAFRHIVWADETNKAEPFWDADEVVPDYVAEKIREVVHNSVYDDIQSIPGEVEDRIADLMAENLTQPQGWSLSSIAEDLQDIFGIGQGDAELVGRTETAKVLNEAREEGYRDAGAMGDERFTWIGPQDHRTTDACEWLKEQTEGGVSFGRLLELEEQAADEFFPNLDFRKHVIHPNERHTFTETFKLDHPAADGVEVEHKWDWSPAMAGAGTFTATS